VQQAPTGIAPDELSASVPLSVSQEALWIAWELNPGQVRYLLPYPLRVEGQLELGRLRRAAEEIGARYPILRGRVVSAPSGPRLCWAGAPPVPVVEQAVTGPVDAAVRRASREPFDLRTGPLIRITLLRGDDAAVLLVCVHHMVFDGGSFPTFLADLRRAYRGEPLGPAEDRAGIARHAARQRALAGGDEGRRHRDFWRRYLQGAAPLRLPSGPDAGQPSMETHPLDRALVRRAADRARELGTTRFGFFFAAFFLLLRRLLGQDELVIAMPFHGRVDPALKRAVGFFSNSLPIRQRIADADTYSDVVRAVHRNVRGVLAYGELPMSAIIPELQRAWPGSRDIPALFQYWNADLRDDLDVRAVVLEGTHGRCTLETLTIADIAEYTLALMVRDDSAGTTVVWKDPEGALGPSLIASLHEDYTALLRDMIDSPLSPAGRADATAGGSNSPLSPAGRADATAGGSIRGQADSADRSAPLALPLVRPRRPGPRKPEGVELEQFPAERLERFAADERTSVPGVLLAALAALLSWYTGQDDIVAGLAVTAGTYSGEEGSRRVLRLRVPAELRFRDLARAVTEQAGTDGGNLAAPYGHRVVLRYRGRAGDGGACGDPGDDGDVCLVAEHHGPAIRMHLRFDAQSFDPWQMRAMGAHFLRLLASALDRPGTPVGQFEPLSGEERRDQLVIWNDTGADYPRTTITDLLRDQARARPETVALVHGAEHRTYAELIARASAIAGALAARGVQPGELVAVRLPRGIAQVEAVLGVLFAGAAYLGVDHGAPAGRLAFFLEDAQIRWMITGQPGTGDAGTPDDAGGPAGGPRPATRSLPVDDLASGDEHGARPALVPEQPAYCIYTSGTTGRPKGVVISHENLVRLIRTDRSPFDFSANDVWTLFHSYSFDFSVWETFGCLCYGGRLVVLGEAEARDTQRFWHLLQRERVTVLNQTPSAFSQLQRIAETEPVPLDHLRYVIFGGEKLHPGTLGRWIDRHPRVRMVNMYGISETTVHSTVRFLTRQDVAEDVSNIGMPIPTTNVYLADPRSRARLLPVGAVGEILVGGRGVASGYINRPGLTAERFAANPFGEGTVYRSGDLARYRPDGTLEFIGRRDDQVKVRGYRIELGEIECRLREHGGVADAVVQLERRDGQDEGRLVGYVLPATADRLPSAVGLRDHVRAALPEYMIPAAFRLIRELPLTANGKTDRAALTGSGVPLPEAEGRPMTVSAQAIAEIWADILQQPAIGADSSFFELGGHSLQVFKLVSEIGERLGARLPLQAVFDHPRLADLADLVDKSRAAAGNPAAPGAYPPEAEEPAGQAAGRPMTVSAQAIAEIWADILQQPAIGADSSFFELGGHSLQVFKLVSEIGERLGARLPLQAVFDHPRLADLADLVDKSRAAAGAPDSPGAAARDGEEQAVETIPVSRFQERVWLAERMEPGAATFNVPLAWRVRGRLDPGALGRALRMLTERHEILRTRFIREDGRLLQAIGRPWTPEVDHADFTAPGEGVGEREALDRMHHAACQPFDTGSGRLLRALLCDVRPQEQMLLLCLHHLVHDGEATPVLLRELDACYAAARRTRRPATGAFAPSPVPPAAAADAASVPASGFQQGVLLAEQMRRGTPTHNIALAWRIDGCLDSAALRRALALLVDRHEILRTRFAQTPAGEFRQVVGESWAPAVDHADLRMLPPDQERDQIRARLLAALDHRFDPAEGMLLEASLLDVTDRQQVLIICLHHLVFDGQSVPPLLAELGLCYQAALGEDMPPPPRHQYRDFVLAELAERDSARRRAGLAYWADRLRNAPAYLPLGGPADGTNRADGPDGAVPVPLPGDFPERMRRLQAEHRVTLTMAAAAALAAVLHRWTGLDDVTFGCPVANRGLPVADGLIGPCLNTVPIRSRATGQTTVTELLANMRTAVLEAVEHQDVPFGEIVNRLGPARRSGWIPYADIVLSMYSATEPAVRPAGHRLMPIVAEEQWAYTVQAGMVLTLVSFDDHVDAVLSYRGDRFSSATAESVAAVFGHLLSALPDQAGRPVLPLAAAVVGQVAPPRHQYRDFVLAELAERDSARRRAGLAYWADRLRNAPAYLPLGGPADGTNRADGPDGAVPVPLPGDFPERMRRLQAEHRVTLTMAAAAALAAVLHRWTGLDDITLGYAAANRPEEYAGLLGPCVNTLVLRSRMDPGITLAGLLREVRDSMLGGLEHQAVPFEAIVDELNPPRRAGRTPFLDAALAIEYEPRGRPTVGGIILQPTDLAGPYPGFAVKAALALIMRVSDGECRAMLAYRGDLVDQADAEQLGKLIGRSLARFGDHLGHRVGTLNLLDDDERRRIAGFEAGPPAAPRTSVPALLADQCARHPDAAAVESAAGTLSYADLLTRARQVAGHLRPLIRRADAVAAVVLDRGPDLVVAMLGAWLAGAAFCPVDPGYPVERRTFMLEELDACAVLTAGAARCRELGRHQVPVMDVTALPAGGPPGWAPPDPDRLAYVLYTSGTTGRPKGAMVSHGSLAQLVQWHNQTFGLRPSDRVSHVTSIGFDVTQYEVWPCLAAGACLVPYEAPVVVPDLARWFAEREITAAVLPTPLAEAIWTAGIPLPSLRLLSFGGAARTKRPPERARYRITNQYGLAETTVCSTADTRPGPRQVLNRIGRPVGGTSVYVVDDAGQRCPVGVPGEIVVAGAGVATGYWRRPQLTAERFLPSGPEGGPGPAFRTGDRGRWLADGNLEYLGRIDRQLKIRGHRIEPQEIEASLLEDPQVRNAIVQGYADRSPSLVAYLEHSGPGTPDTQAVIGRLAARLPKFMVPEAVVWLDELPMSPHGKVDTSRLPLPSRKDLLLRSAWTEPASQLEKRICAVWSRVLGVEPVGTQDNFFDLGGNSMLLVTLHELLEQEIGREFPVQKLFEYSTVAAFSQWAARPQAPPRMTADPSGLDAIRRRAAAARQAAYPDRPEAR
jgi:amino acid adenylation domain-containing protein